MAGAVPQTPLGELKVLPRPPTWIEWGLLIREGRKRAGKWEGTCEVSQCR